MNEGQNVRCRFVNDLGVRGSQQSHKVLEVNQEAVVDDLRDLAVLGLLLLVVSLLGLLLLEVRSHVQELVDDL